VDTRDLKAHVGIRDSRFASLLRGKERFDESGEGKKKEFDKLSARNLTGSIFASILYSTTLGGACEMTMMKNSNLAGILSNVLFRAPQILAQIGRENSISVSRFTFVRLEEEDGIHI